MAASTWIRVHTEGLLLRSFCKRERAPVIRTSDRSGPIRWAVGPPRCSDPFSAYLFYFFLDQAVFGRIRAADGREAYNTMWTMADLEMVRALSPI